MSDEHEHDFKETFIFDPEMKKTIQTWRCVCGLAKDARVHH